MGHVAHTIMSKRINRTEIKVACSAGTILALWRPGLTEIENHRRALHALTYRLGWFAIYGHGHLKDGHHVFVELESDNIVRVNRTIPEDLHWLTNDDTAPRFRINPNPRQLYANSEIRILGALRHRKCDTAEIREAVYAGRKPPPNASTGLSAILSTLLAKVALNKEAFVLKRTPRQGPGVRIEYWLEPRKGAPQREEESITPSLQLGESP